MSVYYYLVDLDNRVQMKAGNKVNEEQFYEEAKELEEWFNGIFYNEPNLQNDFDNTPYNELTINHIQYLNECRKNIEEKLFFNAYQFPLMYMVFNILHRDIEWDYYSELDEDLPTKYKDYPLIF